MVLERSERTYENKKREWYQISGLPEEKVGWEKIRRETRDGSASSFHYQVERGKKKKKNAYRATRPAEGNDGLFRMRNSSVAC